MAGSASGLNGAPSVVVDHYREIADTPEDKRRRVVAAIALAAIALVGVAIAVSSGYLLAHSVTLVSVGIFVGLVIATLSTTATITLLIYHFHKNSEQRRALGSLSYQAFVSMVTDGSLSVESLREQLLADAKVSYQHFTTKIGSIDRIQDVHLIDEARKALADSYLQTVGYEPLDEAEQIPMAFQRVPEFLQRRMTAALDFFESRDDLNPRAYAHLRRKYPAEPLTHLEALKDRLKKAYLRLGFTENMQYRGDIEFLGISSESLYTHLKIPMFNGTLVGATRGEHDQYLIYLMDEFKERRAEGDLRAFYVRIGTLGLNPAELFDLYRPLFCPIESASVRASPSMSPPPPEPAT